MRRVILLTILLALFAVHTDVVQIIHNMSRLTQHHKLLQIGDIYKKIIRASGLNIRMPSVMIDEEGDSAYFNGTSIHISRGFLNELNNKHELALILAHELSHHLLKHHNRLLRTYVFTDSRTLELHADMYATFLVDKAGFDSCKGAKYWLYQYYKLGSTMNTATHPSPLQRYHYLTDGRCD